MPRIAQRKLKFVIGHRAPRELLGCLKSQRGFRLGAIGVRELSLTRGLFNVGLKLALGVNRHSHLERGNVLAVGNATGVALDLADLIGVLARLGISNLAKVNGCLALIEIGIGHSYGRGCGHRGVILGRRGELKLKLVRIRPAAALEHLGQAKAGLGIHRCRRHVVLIANLAVVAQMDVNLCGVRLCRHVVPLGVEHVGHGAGEVTAHALLGGVELINKGQACGSLAKRQVSTRVAHDGALKVRSVFTGKLNNSSTGFGLSVCAQRLKLILVVILATDSQRTRCGRRAVLIRVNGSLLLEIVIAVGVGRLKVRDRVAQRASVPLVRVEVNGLGTVLRGGRIALDVVLEPLYVLGRKQVIERFFLNA